MDRENTINLNILQRRFQRKASVGESKFQRARGKIIRS